MRKTPKLRFAEFSGEWEEKKLGSLCTFLKGSGLSKEDISTDGKPCILYGELYTKYGEVISEIYSKTNLEGENFVYSKKNDVLIPSSGETAIDIATASCMQDDGVILGGDLNIMRSTEINGIFLSYQLNNAKRNHVAKVAQGASVVHIYNEQLKKIVVDVPEFGEQEKLASLFSLIDKKIKKQQEKNEALEDYKKGIMQKIFSQEIRFKDENGEEYPKWKKVDFKNLFEEVKEKTSDTEKHKLYSLTIENGVVPKSERYEREFLVTKEEENYKIVHKNEYVYNPMNLRFGALARHIGENPVSVSGYYNIFKTIDNCSYGFLDNFLKTNRMMYVYNTIATGSLIEKRRVHFSQFIELSLHMPSIKEQQKIADLLLTIDKKLNKEKEKLEQLKELKKGLLQQMFV